VLLATLPSLVTSLLSVISRSFLNLHLSLLYHPFSILYCLSFLSELHPFSLCSDSFCLLLSLSSLSYTLAPLSFSLHLPILLVPPSFYLFVSLYCLLFLNSLHFPLSRSHSSSTSSLSYPYKCYWSCWIYNQKFTCWLLSIFSRVVVARAVVAQLWSQCDYCYHCCYHFVIDSITIIIVAVSTIKGEERRATCERKDGVREWMRDIKIEHH